jgi:hypothetical protein
VVALFYALKAWRNLNASWWLRAIAVAIVLIVPLRAAERLWTLSGG